MLAISGVSGAGLRELGEAMWIAVAEARQEERQAASGPRIDLGNVFEDRPGEANSNRSCGGRSLGGR